MLKTPGLCSYHADRQVSCLVCSGSVGTADPGTDPNRVPGATHASARISGIGAARRHASELRIRRSGDIDPWCVAVLAGPTSMRDPDSSQLTSAPHRRRTTPS